MGDPESPDGTETPEDVDPGAPIALLADLREPPRVGFFERIWNSVERRQLGGSFVELVWHVPFVLLKELLNAVSELLKQIGKGEGGRD